MHPPVLRVLELWIGLSLLVAGCVFSYGASAAALFVTPDFGTYTVGKSFTVSVRVNTEGQVINAAQGQLDFSRSVDKLEVVSISRASSVFSIWAVEPQFNNQAGQIEFAGGVPSPGFVGSNGAVLTVTFRPKTAGSALVLFSRGAVLLNDGRGTNVLSRLSGANYTFDAENVVPEISPSAVSSLFIPDVSSPTHPDQNAWYQGRMVEVQWPLPVDITSVSFAFNQKSIADPGPISDGLFDHKTFDNVGDGVWYFHVKYRNDRAWSDIAHFRVRIDGTPPSTPVVENITKDPTDPTPQLQISTHDDLSGIARVVMKIGDGDFFDVGAPNQDTFIYTLPLQYPGVRPIVVRAYDRAGNMAETSDKLTVLGIEKPVITDYPRAVDTLTDIVVKGTARSEYRVIARLARVDGGSGASIEQEVPVEANGHWTATFGKLLPADRYRLSAVTVDRRGAHSERTEAGEILVTSAFLRIGSFIITYGSIFLLLLLVIAALAALLIWLWTKLQLFRRWVKKEVREAESAVHKAFDLLREDVREQIKLIEKARSRRQLTEEEEKIVRQLRKDLDEAEKFMMKEVGDISDLIR